MIKTIKSNEFKPRGIVQQTFSSTSTNTAVALIIANIIKRGDAALREYTEEFDGCVLDNFELTQEAIEKAASTVDPEFISIMERAANNISDFHKNQYQQGLSLPTKNGVILGQGVTPIERVGVYVPGGTASYPSSVLMNCIPAKIAGVKEVIIVTPPSNKGNANNKDSGINVNGVDARVLAAAKIVGVDRVFTIGGAQAIAALAFGTETIPHVDKITGPGNAYVAEAKRQVFGIVGIDMVAGPSDILIIADDSADPELIAADMLAQCEHGPDSPAILITDSTVLAEKVSTEIKAQLSQLPREEIAHKAIDEQGLIIVAESIDEAFEISNVLAPEHLAILLDEPFYYVEKVRNAGAVFIGKYTAVALGDYYAGPNHTLPTSGTARFSSPLTVDDFTKKTSYISYSKKALHAVGKDVMKFAEEEGLKAHALSIQKRLDKGHL